MQTNIIILAAGHGKRMQSETPKVLSLLHGKPLIRHLLDSVESSGVSAQPVIVVGQKRELVMAAMGPAYRYAPQEEQLGTGHAVLSAEGHMDPGADSVIVLYGDMPYVSADTIKALAATREATGATLVMATVRVPDFDGWRAGFHDFSRVLRNADGTISRTVEKKDATEEDLFVTEVNPCYFCFDAAWLWPRLKELKNANAQKEYYLTDLVGMAVREGVRIESVSIDPKEALGVNTREHLELLETL